MNLKSPTHLWRWCKLAILFTFPLDFAHADIYAKFTYFSHFIDWDVNTDIQSFKAELWYYGATCKATRNQKNQQQEINGFSMKKALIHHFLSYKTMYWIFFSVLFSMFPVAQKIFDVKKQEERQKIWHSHGVSKHCSSVQFRRSNHLPKLVL